MENKTFELDQLVEWKQHRRTATEIAQIRFGMRPERIGKTVYSWPISVGFYNNCEDYHLSYGSIIY